MCSCNDSRDDDIRDTLRRNVGRLCTIYTTSCGRGGDGFTGILSDVDRDTCKLVCFNNRNSCNRSRNCSGNCGGNLGEVQTIPIDKITCVTTCPY